MNSDLRAVLRIAFVAALAVGIWALAHYDTYRPGPLPDTAPAAQFSAGRAGTVLARNPRAEIPHPASSDENAAVRARVLQEYAALGVPTQTYRALGCNLSPSYSVLSCATVTDVIADVQKGPGKAIVMLSHYDSVPAGPGASDDESGTATILESVRALKASSNGGRHPIIAVNTDGEEFGLLGAASFLDNPDYKARVGAVVNVEARGNRGPSLLFQTSPGDGPLIDLYAKNVRSYATSSLYQVIYKALPNDTDLTLFIRDGFLSWNFAFSGDVAHYHTALDRRTNLDPTTLQMHGENLLGMVRGLEQTDYASLKGHDDIYLTVLGRWLPRMPAAWSLPLALLGLVVLLFLAFRKSNGETSEGGWVSAALVVPALVIGAVVIGFVLYEIASLVSGQPDPAYAYPSTLRASLALGVLAFVIATARLAGPRKSLLAVWIWMAALGSLSAALVTGLSPYYLFPLQAALPFLLILLLANIDLSSWTGRLLLLLSALPALMVWIGIVETGESVQGLSLHELFTILSAAFGLATILPLIDARAMSRSTWLSAFAVVGGLALVLSIAAGFQPAYSKIAPQRLDIDYVVDAVKHRTIWAADAIAPLPPSLRAAADFSRTPEKVLPFARVNSYVAPAPDLHYAVPTADVKVSQAAGGVRHVVLALHGAGRADQVVVVVPKEAGVTAIEIDGKHFVVPAAWANSFLPADIVGCFSRDCADKTVAFDVSAKGPVTFTIGELRYGLPPEADKLVAARPDTAVRSQNGDVTEFINSVTIPAS